MIEKPLFITDAHLKFLDELRASGDTNMFGARSDVMDEFPELTKTQASTVLSYWMKSFGERHP